MAFHKTSVTDTHVGQRSRAQPLERSGLRIGHTVTAWLLAVCTTLLLALTSPQIGVTWDEPVYFAASESYSDWFGRLVEIPRFATSQAGIDAYWEINHEHPPLDKIWSGAIWRATRAIVDDLTAHRLGNILLVGLLVALLYRMVAVSYGIGSGLAAVVALLTMPRFFFHAHLAALDMPAAVMFFAPIALFWHTREHRNPLWGVLLGLVWGAGLATKINAAFVLPVLFLWIVFCMRRWYLVLRLALMTIIGPFVFVALWPWLYHDTRERLEEYIRFITVDHWKIDQWYLGQSYMPPPWHFPFVMLIMVVPLTIMLFALVGMLRTVRDPRPGSPGWLWAIAVLMPLVALTTGRSMVYDNERLFMPAFPFIAALAGIGLGWAVRGLYTRLGQAGRQQLARPVAALAVAATLAPQLGQSAMLYPHLLSYYSETVGGLPGAVRLGMETTYWCETYAAALPYLNEHAEQGALIWSEEWSHDVLIYYQLTGRLRPDLRIALTANAESTLIGGRRQGIEASISESVYVIWHTRESGMTDEIRAWINGREPVFRLEREGVTLMAVYRR